MKHNKHAEEWGDELQTLLDSIIEDGYVVRLLEGELILDVSDRDHYSGGYDSDNWWGYNP